MRDALVAVAESDYLLPSGRNMPNQNQKDEPFDRRVFLRSGIVFAGAMLAGSGTLRGAEEKKSKEIELGPPEDLMREHGVLKRVLLIYGEVSRRLDEKQDFPPEALADAARIIRSFVEDYHEKLEEDFLFPRFEKAKLLVDLVKVLRAQHQAGRQVTDVTMRFANLQSLRNESERGQLIASMQQFIRMYSPHEAREDTVLFPAFRKIVSPHEFDALGEDFEKKEDELFGEEGFEKVVDKVAGIEKRFGIYDLTQFTPKM
jgi:hemerythrin-like domain-containing protein